MYKIIALIRKYRFFLLFLVLECIGLLFTLNYHSYQRSKYINKSNAFNAVFQESVFGVSHYFSLEKENGYLIEENLELKRKLYRVDNNLTSFEIESAKVIDNKFKGRNNILLIDKGSADSIKTDMGVINAKGVIGIVNHSSKNFSSVLSILNPSIQLNARLLNSNYFGTISWNSEDYNTVQLEDIPREALISKGDTVVTGGRSVIFPDGIPIGIISTIENVNNRFSRIDITLFNDMANIRDVYVVENKNLEEILELEKLEDE
jgi:rod shape-determining protein MreC